MTINRLASFQTAFQNLNVLPLRTPEELDRFRVEYGTEIIQELKQLVTQCAAEDNKIIFTGHRGSGKSTLLGEFCRQVKDDYFVVFFSISDLIEMSDVNHVNILFAMAVKLMEDAKTRGVKIAPKTEREFYLWFSKHTKTESSSRESTIELEAGIEGGASAWFAKFFAKLKATLKANSVIREEIKLEFDIAAAIEAASGREVLVVIDDLDKLDLEIVNHVYRNNINALFQPHFRIIYTIPMASVRDLSLRSIINNATTNRIQSMWATKFFARGADRQPDAVPVLESMELFEKILYKRIPADLVEPEVAKLMILKSGGALREFIRLARQCCQICSMELMSNPENQDIRITNRVLDKTVADIRINMTEPLGQNAFDILAQVYNENTPKDGMDQTFLDLLHGLYILEYRNDDLWFGVNPIVKDLLKRRGLI
jgi:energy-coupling factor transporter ATP-binding protein EcfA2